MYSEQYWRARAAETRKLAKEAKDGVEKEMIRQIAESYDELAKSAAELAQRSERGEPACAHVDRRATNSHNW